jgi:hypothetical protein
MESLRGSAQRPALLDDQKGKLPSGLGRQVGIGIGPEFLKW